MPATRPPSVPKSCADETQPPTDRKPIHISLARPRERETRISARCAPAFTADQFRVSVSASITLYLSSRPPDQPSDQGRQPWLANRVFQGRRVHRPTAAYNRYHGRTHVLNAYS